MLATGPQQQHQQLTEDLLHCSICFEPFSTPKTLPCLHTFCESCLNDHFTAFQSTKKKVVRELPCPTCRECCYLPPEGIPGLKSDFKVSKMAELIKCVKDRQGETERCNVCSEGGIERKTTHFCGTCSLNLCRDCTRVHDDNPLFKGHSATRTVDTQSSLMCKGHPMHSAQHYCSHCKEPVCTMCIMTRHSSHSEQVIECKVLQRQRLQRLQKPCQASIDQVKKALQEIQKLETNASICYIQSRECVEQTKAKLQRQIEEKATRLLTSLAESESKQHDAIVAEQEKLLKRLGELQSVQQYSLGLLADEEKKTFYPGLDKAVTQMEEAMRSTHLKLSQPLKIGTQFKPNFDIDIGKLVKIDLVQNKLMEEDTEKVPAKKPTPEQTLVPTVEAPPKAKSRFSIFGLGSKSKSSKSSKKKSRCYHCDSTHCTCRLPVQRCSSEQILTTTDQNNRTRSRIDSATQLREADLPREDPKKCLETYDKSSPLEPSAPPDSEVFEDSGICDSPDSSDQEVGISSSSEKFQSAEDLSSDSLRKEEAPELKASVSMQGLCTSDQCAPPSLLLEVLEPKVKKPATKVAKLPQRTTTKKTTPSSSSSSTSSTSSSSSESSSPIVSRQRSRSNPIGNTLHNVGFGSRRESGGGWSSKSFSGLVLTEVLDHLSKGQMSRNSFRY